MRVLLSTSWRNTRKTLKYEADGLVLKVNNLQAQALLGSTGADPRWALAWKVSLDALDLLILSISLLTEFPGMLFMSFSCTSLKSRACTVKNTIAIRQNEFWCFPFSSWLPI